jgi:hypothetical protein
MKCNIEKYLEEQELSCLRMARAANDGTQAQDEWLKTAESIHSRRSQHAMLCKKCKKDT